VEIDGSRGAAPIRIEDLLQQVLNSSGFSHISRLVSMAQSSDSGVRADIPRRRRPVGDEGV
jgi:hypothetical protein